MNQYEQAGRLLALAEKALSDRADGLQTPDAALVSNVLRAAAVWAATHGTARALGWLDGYWYATGNSPRPDDLDNHETWRRGRALLGEEE